jgi:hypothetical protein
LIHNLIDNFVEEFNQCDKKTIEVPEVKRKKNKRKIPDDKNQKNIDKNQKNIDKNQKNIDKNGSIPSSVSSSEKKFEKIIKDYIDNNPQQKTKQSKNKLGNTTKPQKDKFDEENEASKE